MPFLWLLVDSFIPFLSSWGVMRRHVVLVLFCCVDCARKLHLSLPFVVHTCLHWELSMYVCVFTHMRASVHPCMRVCDMYMIYCSFQQLWTVAVCLTQPMVKLITMLEQLSDRQPPILVIQATSWWEAVFAHVKLQELQECGLGVHLPVNVCYCISEYCNTSELNVYSS